MTKGKEMKRLNFQRVKRNHAKYGSFAVWNPNDLTDTKVIEKSVSKLHARIVIVGLNASGKVRAFGNFHGRKAGTPGRGNRDSWLRDAFNNPKSPCRGAYITDVFKRSVVVRQNQLNVSERQKDKARKLFERELRDVGARSPIFLTLGKRANLQLLEWGYCPLAVPHYASHISKKVWLSKVRAVVRKM